MADASEREREAREAVAGGHSLTCSRSLYATTLCDCGGATRPIAHLDAYRAAVRARILADVIAVVEGTGGHLPTCCHRTRADILTRLREMEGHTDG